jgi:predicted phage terminase large subunit-like protein
MQMNPQDNAENLPPDYLTSLQNLPARLQKRFWLGQYGELAPNALFADDRIDLWRVLDGKLPDFQRVVVAVDPSGSGDQDNADNDEIGIVVAALGTDGRGYLLEDLTVKAGPATWGKIVTNAYDRHSADRVVAEGNYGGAMVAHVIQTARPRTPFSLVTATRGKVVRAEPISSLVEEGKVRMVGYFPDLEEELSGFTTNGYTGDRSPNRADAFVWAFTELFPGLTRKEGKLKPIAYPTEAVV